MGRLIDEDDVISVIANHHFDNDKNNFDLLLHNLCKEVKQIPTAYDVEAKLAEMEEEKYSISLDYDSVYWYRNALDTAMEIAQRDECRLEERLIEKERTRE